MPNSFSKLLLLLFLYMVTPYLSEAATVHKNNIAGYSIELPDGWYVLNESDSQDVFYNESISSSYLSVTYSKISQNITEIDWTRYYYMIYLTIVEEWEDPWGTILTFDSSQTSTINNTWAPQVYVQFISLDSVITNWLDYTIFTAKNGIGYELTATGDTLDIKNNGATYLQIFQSITFFPPSAIRKPTIIKSKKVQQADYRVFDILGRNISSVKHLNRSTMIQIQNKKLFINNMK